MTTSKFYAYISIIMMQNYQPKALMLNIKISSWGQTYQNDIRNKKTFITTVALELQGPHTMERPTCTCLIMPIQFP
jgi:hypothetical protein